MRKLTNILLLMTLCPALSAQTPDTVTLTEVKVEGFPSPSPAGTKVTELDTTQLQEHRTASLGEALQRLTPIYIKSYGQGSLASPSFRGTGARHTSVYWNDMAIKYPTVGQTDLSLFPVHLSERLSVSYGAASLASGSGGFGGSIHFDQQPQSWTPHLSLGLTQAAGSFGRHQSVLEGHYGGQQGQGSTGLYYQTAQNDFPYRDFTQPDTPTLRQNHARLSRFGFKQSGYFKIDDRNLLSAYAWYQASDREIPPSMLTSGQRPMQSDDWLHTILKWQHTTNRAIFSAHSGYSNTGLIYRDTTTAINSRTFTNTWDNQLQYKRKLGDRLLLRTQLEHTYDEVRTTGYDNQRSRHTTAATTALESMNIDFLKLTLLLRQELINNTFSAPLPKIGATIQPFQKENFFIKLQGARNYKVPSLNDLYWVPGGNPELKPEHGWSGELGLQHQADLINEHLQMQWELTGYYTRIEDWILWQPVTSGYWSAQNLKEVHARGLEARLELRGQWEKLHYTLSGHYSLTRSTNEQAVQHIDYSVGKQLIYIPIHKANGFLRISRNGFYGTYTQTYTGKRYINADHSWYLPPYLLGQLTFGYRKKYHNFTGALQMTVKNLWNEQYQAIAWRPMPGRHYLVTLRLNFRS